MIIKAIGITAVIISSWFAGAVLSFKSKFRLDDLEELKKAINIFINDTVNTSLPLSIVFEDISKRVNGPVAMIFNTAFEISKTKSESCAEDILRKAVEKNMKNLVFESDDMECIYSFAKNLDCAYKINQKKGAEIILENIQQIKNIAVEKSKKEVRLYNSCGILGGILICILLL